MVVQNQILNKILATKDYSIVTVNNLNDEYFSEYKNEFNFIKTHKEKYHVIPDLVTFLNVFPDFDVIEVTEPDSFLVEKLYVDYNRNFLARRFNTVKAMLENDETEKAVDYYLKSVEQLQQGGVLTCTDLISDTSRFDRYEERIADPVKSYLSTGFKELDKLIGGIDRENENLVISARPGVGKTQLLIKLAVNAAQQGLTVGIFEGEMTADKVGYRVDTILGNGYIKNSAINRGDVSIRQTYKQYIEGLKSINCAPIKVMTLPDAGNNCTVSTLRAFIEKEHLDILFIDQYSLMEDERRAKGEFERVGNIAKDIKKLQTEKKIPIISVSQMNRTKNEDGSQDTTQISLSDKIPQYATVLIMLEQKESDSFEFPVTLTLNIVKSRDGGDHNKLTYGVNFNTGLWTYIPTDKDGITTDEDVEELAESYSIKQNNKYDVDIFNDEDIPF